MAPSLYRAYGLTFASDIEFPELVSTTEPADVQICYGKVPYQLEKTTAQGVLYQINPEQCLLNLEQLAGVRYLIQNGSEIMIECKPNAYLNDVRLFLLGSCMAALLYQRNELPLHGSAIQTSNGSVIFSGPSGIGKSTVAAAFHERGYKILSDDISVIKSNVGGAPFVWPGYPRLKLWADSLHKLDKQTAVQTPVRPAIEKYEFPVKANFVNEALPVQTIYILQATNTNELRLEDVHGMAKLALLQNNIYRDKFAAGMGKQLLLFQQVATLVQHVQVRRIIRPRHCFMLNELVELVEQDFA